MHRQGQYAQAVQKYTQAIAIDPEDYQSCFYRGACHCALERHQQVNNSVEAALSQTILEERGIQSWLKDEATVSNTWYLTIAVGGIKLCVDRQDAAVANTIVTKNIVKYNND